MKTIAALVFLFAVASFADPYTGPNGERLPARPPRIAVDGFAVDSPTDETLAAAGYAPATPGQIAAWEADDAAAASAAEQARVAALAKSYGGFVTLLRGWLVQVGHDLPGVMPAILASVTGRSAAGTLSAEQEVALSKMTDIYLMLSVKLGLSDADINAVWEAIK